MRYGRLASAGAEKGNIPCARSLESRTVEGYD